jgi:hypothetical protein
MAVSQVRLPVFLISTAISNSKSLNTSFLEIVLPSKNEHVIIFDFRDLTLPIIFDAWWASMNVASKRFIALNKFSNLSSLRFYLHCGIEEPGSPGIICIMCHPVFCNSSESGTCSMWKHMLENTHFQKFNKLTESEVSELSSSIVDEMALDILKR